MPKKIRFLITLFFLFSIGNSYAQEFSKLHNKGEQFLKKDQYEEAIKYFSSLDSTTKSQDPLYNYYMGMSYFLSPDQKLESIPFFKAYLTDSDSSQIELYGHHHVYYLLGKIYHLNYEFDLAIELYNQFITAVASSKTIPVEQKAEIYKSTNREIEGCKFGKIAVKNPRNVVLENLGDSINTIYPEYAAVVSQDENKLIFTSRRPDTKGGKKAKTGGYYEDIYSADLDKGSLFEQKNRLEDSTRGLYFSLVTDFEYSNFHPMSDEINSNDHDGSIQLAQNDSVLFFYHDDDIWSIEIYPDSGVIPEAKKMGVHVNSEQYEPSIFFSYDGEKLFIVSDRPGGFGGLDIYLSTIQENGQWSSAINLGAKINTEYDEDAPYLDPDEKTFYFSSRGHSSMGEFDIFRSILTDTTWSHPVNLGFPINTPGDDIYFTMTHRYNRGYYASSDLKGKGDMDLYRITFADERDPVAELLGFIKKGENLVPAKSTITLTNIAEDEKISQESDTIKGDYFLLLGHGKTYQMVVETKNFAPYRSTIAIPEQKEYFQLYQEIHHVHLYNQDGDVIGQQITIYNALGGTDSITMFYNQNTLDRIELVKDNQGIEGSIFVMSELKFYFTDDSLYKMMLQDLSIDFDIDSETTVLFLKNNGDDINDPNSYVEYTSSMIREEFIKDHQKNDDEVETPEGTIDVASIEGLFFTVQIGVYSRDIDHSYLFNLEPIVTQRTANELFRYSTGTFNNVESALKRKDEIVKIGVTDAFVTAYYKGKRITVEEALELITQGGNQIIISP